MTAGRNYRFLVDLCLIPDRLCGVYLGSHKWCETVMQNLPLLSFSLGNFIARTRGVLLEGLSLWKLLPAPPADADSGVRIIVVVYVKG